MWCTQQAAPGGPCRRDIPGEHTDPQRKRRRLSEAAQQSPSYLILGEENQPGHQDIDNIAQTRVLEKFGNLTSKKQEKTSLKNELTGWGTVQPVGKLGRAGHRAEGHRAASSARAVGPEDNLFREHVTPRIAEPLHPAQTSASPPGEIRAAKLLLLPSPLPSRGTVRPRGWGGAVCPSAGATGHPSESCHRAVGALRQMKRLGVVLFENLASALEVQTEQGHGERPCRGHRGAVGGLLGHFPAYLTSREDSAQPTQAARASSLVSCHQQGLKPDAAEELPGDTGSAGWKKEGTSPYPSR